MSKKQSSAPERAKKQFVPPTQKHIRAWNRAIKYINPRALKRFFGKRRARHPEIIAFWRKHPALAKRSRTPSLKQLKILLDAVAACVEWRDSRRRVRINERAAAEAEKGRERKTGTFRIEAWGAVEERNATTKDTADLVLTLTLIGYARVNELQLFSKHTWGISILRALLGISDDQVAGDAAAEDVFRDVRDRVTRARAAHGRERVEREARECWKSISKRMQERNSFIDKVPHTTR